MRKGIALVHRLIFFLCVAAFCLNAQARHVSLTVVFTTDLHGHFWPTEDYDGRQNLGGLLRCATRIEQIRTNTGNTVLIDVGDTYQGSPESFLTGGRLMIEALNILKYDAWVLGNHEIDWGPASLKSLHDAVEVPFLAANLYFLDQKDNWLPRVQSHVMKEVDGIKVAIIGLTTPGIPRWSRPPLLDKALFKRSVDALNEIMPAVRAENPDVIIVAAHQGIRNRGDDFANEIRAIAANFPEIDLLLGGHTHRPIEEERMNGVLFSQSGYHGIWLGQAELVYDTVEKKVISKKSRLELMDDSVAFHPGLLERFGPQLEEARNRLDEIVGHLDHRLDPEPDAIGRSSMQDFICRAIARESGAELVLHGSLDDKAVEPGPVRYRDIWRIVPYENTIGVLSLTPAEISKVLENNHSRSLTTQSLGPFGFSYQLEGSGTHVVIRDMVDAEGKPLHSRKRYRVAFNSYTLASGGERYLALRDLADQPESRLQMITTDTRSMVLDYIKESIRHESQDAGVSP